MSSTTVAPSKVTSAGTSAESRKGSVRIDPDTNERYVSFQFPPNFTKDDLQRHLAKHLQEQTSSGGTMTTARNRPSGSKTTDSLYTPTSSGSSHKAKSRHSRLGSRDDLDAFQDQKLTTGRITENGDIEVDTGRHLISYRHKLAEQLFDYSTEKSGVLRSDATKEVGGGLPHNVMVPGSWDEYNQTISRIKESLADDERLVVLMPIRHEKGYHNAGWSYDRDPRLTPQGLQHAAEMHEYWEKQFEQGMPYPDSIACSDLMRCADTLINQYGMPKSNPNLASLKPHQKLTALEELSEFWRGKQARPSTQFELMTEVNNCDAITTMQKARDYNHKTYFESDSAFSQRVMKGVSAVIDLAPDDATHITLGTHHGWAKELSRMFRQGRCGQGWDLSNGSAYMLPLIVKNKEGVDPSTRATSHVPEHICAARLKAISSNSVEDVAEFESNDTAKASVDPTTRSGVGSTISRWAHSWRSLFLPTARSMMSIAG